MVRAHRKELADEDRSKRRGGRSCGPSLLVELAEPDS